MTYSEKLKDPRWQKVRLEIMDRDRFKCVCCQNSEMTLHVHHLEYHRDPWKTPSDKLITLCEECHAFVESVKKSICSKLGRSKEATASFYFTDQLLESQDQGKVNAVLRGLLDGELFDLVYRLSEWHWRGVEKAREQTLALNKHKGDENK